MNILKYKIGDTASYTKIVTLNDISNLGEFSKDFNPIHFDEEYAKSNKFKGVIAHGLFCLAMISKVIGMDMPGPGAVFLNENLKYLYPVYVDDSITTKVTIESIDYTKRLILVDILCINQDNKKVMVGTSLLKVM